MDPRILAIIAKINTHKKTDHPWRRGEPFVQSYYTWSSQTSSWISVQSGKPFLPAPNSSFSVLSWNIDFMRSFPDERMTVALAFLKQYVSSIPSPCVIMFNEMLVSDLALIQAQPWVRENYNLTDLSHDFWESGYYGTCILVPWALPITNVFRVHYEDTDMQRDGLFVDLAIRDKTIRICSTHLESLVANPPKRPSQLATAARFMHEADGSVLGGDLNAIEPIDKTLHSDNNLKDAYLERGNLEDAEAGMTWGQMASTRERDRFGLSRMDKLMFCGTIDIGHFETFGINVVVDDTAVGEKMMVEDGLEKAWVTDHLGIRGDFNVY